MSILLYLGLSTIRSYHVLSHPRSSTIPNCTVSHLTLSHLTFSNFYPTSSAFTYDTRHLILSHLVFLLTGIGSNEKSVVSSTEYDKNRIEVLRVMIAAFSDSLYQVRKVYTSMLRRFISFSRLFPLYFLLLS